MKSRSSSIDHDETRCQLVAHVQREFGVTWYPAKYWAVAAPAFLIVIVSSYGTVYGAICKFGFAVGHVQINRLVCSAAQALCSTHP